MMVTKYTLMKDGALRAPFETEAEVARYRVENQNLVNRYNAEGVTAQTISRQPETVLSELGSMLLGDEIEEARETYNLSGFAESLLDTQAVELMRATFA